MGAVSSMGGSGVAGFGLASLALSLLLSSAGCDAGEEEATEQARLVVTDVVMVEDAVDRLELLGDVRGELEVRVFAQLPERIRTLHVRDGDVVAEGEPIVTLEAELSASDEAQAGAALTAAEATRDRLRGDADRIRELVRQRAVGSSQLDTLEAQLQASEAQVAQVRAARRGARTRRARTVVRAPADGIVALLTVEEGDMVAPTVPICMVVQMDRVDVELRAVEVDYVRLREGMTVEVVPPALPDLRRVGTITRISPVIDRITRTAAVEVRVDNPDHLLRPGMVAEVGIEIGRRADVLMVPADAVLMTTLTDTERTATVFALAGDHAARRAVRIGGRYGGRIEIVEGLEAGDAVVVQGQHLLRDGSPVRVGESAHAQAESP